MLSGDHVLPRITPNIPFHPQAGANPLGDYLDSLDKLRALRRRRRCCRPTSTASSGSARGCEELRAPHERRFAEVIEAIEDGVDTAWDIAARMHWSRPWDDIEVHAPGRGRRGDGPPARARGRGVVRRCPASRRTGCWPACRSTRLPP